MDGFWGDVVKIVLAFVMGAGGLGAVLAYLKDRRLNNAKGEVAVQTVELQVDFTRMQNLESRFAMAERAWDEERASLERRVAAAEAREAALERAVAQRDAKIRELEERVSRVQNELIEVTRELADLRSDHP